MAVTHATEIGTKAIYVYRHHSCNKDIKQNRVMLYTTKIGLPTTETGDKTTEIETQNKNRDKQNGCSHKDRNRDTVTEIGTNTIDVVTKTEIKTPFQKKGQTQQM